MKQKIRTQTWISSSTLLMLIDKNLCLEGTHTQIFILQFFMFELIYRQVKIL